MADLDLDSRLGPSRPSRRVISRGLPASALAIVAVSVTLFGCGGSDSETAQTEAAKSTTTLAAKDASDLPSDQPRHVYVKGAKALAARQHAEEVVKEAAKPKPDPAPKPTDAQLKPGPGGLPPASVGNNGSFTPHSPGELKRIHAQSASSIAGLDPDHSAILVGRTALAPPSAPTQVKRAIGAANAIVGTPYIWGGGHGSWNDRGYDCSGSVSYALGGAGLLSAPTTSSGLESWGEPGPGKWITVYANAGHTYAVIAGLRWDTVGDLRGSGPRWHAELPYPKGFTVRHPPGL